MTIPNIATFDHGTYGRVEQKIIFKPIFLDKQTIVRCHKISFFEAFAKENRLDERFLVCLISSNALQEFRNRNKTHHHEMRFVIIFFNAF